MTGYWRAALTEVKLEPIFGRQPWSRTTACLDIHPRGSIPHGSRCCCMACHQSGKDQHPALAITASDRLELERFDPDDEYAAQVKPTVYHAEPRTKPKTETRRERRARQFGRQTPEPGEEKAGGKP